MHISYTKCMEQRMCHPILGPSVGIVTPPNHTHRLGHISSLLTIIFWFAALLQLSFFSIVAFFLYKMQRTQDLSPMYPSVGILTPLSHNHRLGYVFWLVNKHVLIRSVTVLKAKTSFVFFYLSCIFIIRNARNTESFPIGHLFWDCNTTYPYSSIRLCI